MGNIQVLVVLGLVLGGMPSRLLASNYSQEENRLALGETSLGVLGSNYPQDENGLFLGEASSGLLGSSYSQDENVDFLDYELQFKPEGVCPFPFEDVLGRCLYFAQLTSVWNAMRFYCQRFGGDLLKIDSADFMYGLIQIIESKELVADHFWLGATDKKREGLWTWTDGAFVKMGSPFWGVNCNKNSMLIREPGGGDAQNCVSFERRFFFYFHDVDCAESHSAICEYKVNE
ncbi:type-2 ice-structuring protein-like isoform X2 [Palaemon carinicauda]|uniref:type-2 ice-structuring protein-like isoform X2 n=1 Tax=Palaemon carinicauda TaxID=392227 RepID=UPI0035B5E036